LAQFSRLSFSGEVYLETTERNRKFTLACLRKISEQNELALSETTIMAWGQVGRIVDGDELNMVLHQLLGYLGGSNTLVASCAFSEVRLMLRFCQTKLTDN
jgi:serine/threonine-protein kinase ATR